MAIDPGRIIAVCGLGRCGSTMTMRMLHAGGVPVFCHSTGPNSRFETPYTNMLPKTFDWLYKGGEDGRGCLGKAVKILRSDKNTPPRALKYDFIYLMRNPFEQAKSQVKFIQAHFRVMNEPDVHEIQEIGERVMRKNIDLLRALKEYPNQRVHVMQFETVLADPPGEAQRLAEFLGIDDPQAAGLMAAVVEKRGPECLPGPLEGPKPDQPKGAVTVHAAESRPEPVGAVH